FYVSISRPCAASALVLFFIDPFSAGTRRKKEMPGPSSGGTRQPRDNPQINCDPLQLYMGPEKTLRMIISRTLLVLRDRDFRVRQRFLPLFILRAQFRRRIGSDPIIQFDFQLFTLPV